MDIAKHSSLPGPDRRISETRDNFHRQAAGILAQHNAQELTWAGDGGAFVFLIDKGTEFDRMVTGALQILDSMRLFNALKTLNTLQTPLHIRVSCHKGEAIWDPDLNNFYGKAVNYFLKSERDIGADDSVTITEDVFDQVEVHLGRLFTPFKGHDYEVLGRRYERTIYAFSQAWGISPARPPTWATLVPENYLNAIEHVARTHHEDHLRIACAHAVWSVRPDRALPILEDARRDMQDEVRKHAIALLKCY
jgi:hypothetical protein